MYRKKFLVPIAFLLMGVFSHASDSAPYSPYTNSALANNPYHANQDATSQAAWRIVLKKHAIKISITCLGMIVLVLYIIKQVTKHPAPSPPSYVDDPDNNIDDTTDHIQANLQALIDLVSEENKQEIQRLLNQLHDHDPNKRREAIRHLSKLIEDESITGLNAVAPFMDLLGREQERFIRLVTIRKLQKMLSPDPVIENWLLKMLQKKNIPTSQESEHIAIAKTLQVIAYDKTVEALLKMIEDSTDNNLSVHLKALKRIEASNDIFIKIAKEQQNPSLRKEAIESINTQEQDLRAQDELISLLAQEQDSTVQKAMLNQLGSLMARMLLLNTNFFNQALDQLITIFDNSQEEEIAKAVLEAITSIPFTNVNHEKTSELLFKTAKDSRSSLAIRIEAIRAIKMLGAEKAVDVLMDCLVNDPDMKIREAAAECLQDFAKEGIPDHHATTLINRLKRDEPEADVKESIACALYEIKSDETIEALRYVIAHDPSEQVRSSAQELLALIPTD